MDLGLGDLIRQIEERFGKVTANWTVGSVLFLLALLVVEQTISVYDLLRGKIARTGGEIWDHIIDETVIFGIYLVLFLVILKGFDVYMTRKSKRIREEDKAWNENTMSRIDDIITHMESRKEAIDKQEKELLDARKAVEEKDRDADRKLMEATQLLERASHLIRVAQGKET